MGGCELNCSGSCHPLNTPENRGQLGEAQEKAAGPEDGKGGVARGPTANPRWRGRNESSENRGQLKILILFPSTTREWTDYLEGTTSLPSSRHRLPPPSLLSEQQVQSTSCHFNDHVLSPTMGQACNRCLRFLIRSLKITQ